MIRKCLLSEQAVKNKIAMYDFRGKRSRLVVQRSFSNWPLLFGAVFIMQEHYFILTPFGFADSPVKNVTVLLFQFSREQLSGYLLVF